MTDAKCMQATPAATLEEHIMSSRHAKTEAEWWASREIESLRQQLASLDTMKKQWQREALLEAAEQMESYCGPTVYYELHRMANKLEETK